MIIKFMFDKNSIRKDKHIVSKMDKENTIGKNIKDARNNKKWSQSKLSAATGISNTTISAYENGKKEPGLVTLANIATALEVSLDQLYFGNENEAFLNKAPDKGTKAVNSMFMLWELHAIGSGDNDSYPERYSLGNEVVLDHPYTKPLIRLLKTLESFQQSKATYSDPDIYLNQIKQSVANEINTELRKIENERAFIYPNIPDGGETNIPF